MKHRIMEIFSGLYTYLSPLWFLFYMHPLCPCSADSCPYVNMNVCQERLYITWIEADNEQEGMALFNTPSCATYDTSQAN